MGHGGAELEHAERLQRHVSFGHAALFGLGGYTMTIAFVKFYPLAEAARAHRDLGRALVRRVAGDPGEPHRSPG